MSGWLELELELGYEGVDKPALCRPAISRSRWRKLAVKIGDDAGDYCYDGDRFRL